MALNKGNLNINFAQGLDTKTDPNQVQPGRFLSLQNSVFQKGGLLQKRNGFNNLTTLTDPSVSTLCTFNDSLVALGNSLSNYADGVWYDKGPIQSIQTEVKQAVRSSTGQAQQDAAVTSDGLACIVWADTDGHSKYQIIDSVSSQILKSPTNLTATATQMRVFILGPRFIIAYLVTVGGATHLRYIAIPITNPTTASSPVDMSSTVKTLASGWDGFVINNNLYFSWEDVGGSVKTNRMDSTLQQYTPVTLAGHDAALISVTGDFTQPSPNVWVTFFQSSTAEIYTSAYSAILTPILVISNPESASTGIATLTSTAANGIVSIYWQQITAGYTGAGSRCDILFRVNINLAGNDVTPLPDGILMAKVGLASKAFIVNDLIYVVVAYGAPNGVNGATNDDYQPTYFLINIPNYPISDPNNGYITPLGGGKIVAKLAYSNGGGYTQTQVLPQANVYGNSAIISYLFKDLLTSVNKTQGVANIDGIYSQTGVNLVTWGFNMSPMVPAEIGGSLHLSGGFLWQYDGAKPVEHNFHIWPEDFLVTNNPTGGNMSAQTYFYQWTYEWTDGAGLIHRSAPSVPIKVTTVGTTSSITFKLPELTLTDKKGVRLVGYRWSEGQQNYYQITSIASPVLNESAGFTLFINYTDTLADSAILGNQLIYTTGGVVENIAFPASTDIALFKSRLVLIDAEDQNLLWYSKQVIEDTPVEPSDLFTLYVSPSEGAQGSTGINTALSAMDDKLVIFKRNAIYYLTGTGPDNTGGNNDFSQPVYVTSTAGCTNPQSIVFMPKGLMFQSDKGIWLLGRDLSTTYIGAPVEKYNSAKVLSAINVPATNQVRFTLDNGVTLMYDYYYNQWGTFVGIPGISSTLYQDLHTFVNDLGTVYQEKVGSYLDGTSPVNMQFTTGWMSMAGLQGFERAYMFYLLGTYLSPHKLSLGIAYDYDPSVSQVITVTPDNFAPNYGLEPGPFGSGSPYGGPGNVEQWRFFLEKQKCQSFQISLTESFDPTFGVNPGAGLTLSGINLVVGTKKGYVPLKAARSAG